MRRSNVAGGKRLTVMALLLASTVAGATCLAAENNLASPGDSATVDSLREVARRRLPDSVRFQTLRALSDALFAQDEPEARRVGEQAVQLARHRRDWPGVADALYQLVVNCERAADYVAAMQYSQEGAGVAKVHQLPDEWRFTQCMGLVAVDTKDVKAGLKYMRQAYQQQGAVGNVPPRERGGLLLNLANTFLVMQRYDSVLHYATRALPYMQRARDARGLGYVYQFRGEVYAMIQPQSRATLDSAATNMNRALRIMQRHGFRPQIASSALALARVYRLQGLPAVSQRMAELALALARELKMPDYEADALASLAWAHADQGRMRRSFDLDNRAQDLRDSLFNGDKAQALAQLQVRYDVKLLTEQKRAAEFEQRSQRAQLHSLWLLLGGLTTTIGVGSWLYWRLRRQKALLAVANQANCRSVAEKEVLLQEIHHRVKNNLQLVSGLLGWQASTLPEPTLVAALDASRVRIQSMALVHEFLYQADNLAEVRMDQYLRELLDSLKTALTTPEQTIQLSTDLAPVIMSPKEASTLGLVVNEIVTNAYKHAFQGLAQGHLHVSFASRPTGFQLVIADDGAGMPAGDAPAKAHSLGMQLVRTLTKQLKAKLSVTRSFPTGTQIEVTRE
ncbi:sensor histidine kinase [Hymenobacter ruricola]|uniref:histidine kinase n=1 Tax=Hymenobacter ruricola TaxID=2791023 RepID=A0ABS0I8L4_9BACT|nr:histidine kinase dimerization/phosphoacceptor domain -containing protein [Hymenobacter ruricola]MBF9223301.1 ATP-binding protein [Hymenobacter ruricola]